MKRLFLPLCLALCLTVQATAQKKQLKGTVVDKETRDALPGANVFLNQTTIGVATTTTGAFTLENLPSGKHIVVVSMIGFKPFTYPLDELLALGDRVIIELEPDEVLLGEIKVTSKRPKKWLRNLDLFKEQFIGTGDNAAKTEILNPEVIDFENKGNDLLATVRSPLQIENKALGYHVEFHLKDFRFSKKGLKSSINTDGFAVYRELEPENDIEAQEWANARKKTYETSFTHFIHALFADKLEDENYTVYYARRVRVDNSPNSVKARRKVHRSTDIYTFTNDLSTIKLFNSKSDYLRVERLDGPTSWISFPNESALVDIKTGKEVSSQFRSVLHGHWGLSHRISDLLPKNFRTSL